MLLVIIVFLLIFSFVILAHEFGHFIVARKSGVRIDEFGIGYPPRIWGKKIRGVTYSINWIPFGGFVKIYGENSEKETLKDSDSFCSKSPKIKAGILLAGIGANLFVAIIFFYFLLGFHNFQTFQSQFFDYQFPFGQQNDYPMISEVLDGSPAQEAGINEFDVVIAGNEEYFSNSDELINFIDQNRGEEITLYLANAHNPNEEKIVKLVPRIDPPENSGAIGVMLGDVSRLSYQGIPNKAFSGVLHTLNLGHFTFSALGHLIKISIVEGDIRPLSTSFSGPVGILAFTKLSMAGGVWQLFYFIAAISLGLAVINILPIPAADGGRLVFVIYEAIFKKRAPARVERAVNAFGMFFLLALFLIITIKDIIQFKDILIK
ncbi:site-2 protease family protein [Patescibacteria group bacterium]|nr:site-2 protease family protein [Patescibacteria group bacterium]MBU4162423.1 site-2 protease family protein [Patescibacteria group bacterium]